MKDQAMAEHDVTSYDDEAYDETPERLPYSALAIASFALGLAGLFLFAIPALPLLLSVLAVVFGHTGRREIKQGVKQGWGYDIAGLICGYLVLGAVVIGAVARD